MRLLRMNEEAGVIWRGIYLHSAASWRALVRYSGTAAYYGYLRRHVAVQLTGPNSYISDVKQRGRQYWRTRHLAKDGMGVRVAVNGGGRFTRRLERSREAAAPVPPNAHLHTLPSALQSAAHYTALWQHLGRPAMRLYAATPSPFRTLRRAAVPYAGLPRDTCTHLAAQRLCYYRTLSPFGTFLTLSSNHKHGAVQTYAAATALSVPYATRRHFRARAFPPSPSRAGTRHCTRSIALLSRPASGLPAEQAIPADALIAPPRAAIISVKRTFSAHTAYAVNQSGLCRQHSHAVVVWLVLACAAYFCRGTTVDMFADYSASAVCSEHRRRRQHGRRVYFCTFATICDSTTPLRC